MAVISQGKNCFKTSWIILEILVKIGRVTLEIVQFHLFVSAKKFSQPCERKY